MFSIDEIKNGKAAWLVQATEVIERVIDRRGKTPEEDVILDRLISQDDNGELYVRDLHWFYRGKPNEVHSCAPFGVYGERAYPKKQYVPMPAGF